MWLHVTHLKLHLNANPESQAKVRERPLEFFWFVRNKIKRKIHIFQGGKSFINSTFCSPDGRWKRTFLAACVPYMCLVMFSNTREALKCKTKTLPVSLAVGWESWGRLRGGGGAPLLFSTHGCEEPISTNRLCQLRGGTQGSVVVLKCRSMSGVKCRPGAGREKMAVVLVGAEGFPEVEFKWRWLLPCGCPLADLGAWHQWDQRRGVWFHPPSLLVVWNTQSSWFRGHGLTSQKDPPPAKLPPCWLRRHSWPASHTGTYPSRCSLHPSLSLGTDLTCI